MRGREVAVSRTRPRGRPKLAGPGKLGTIKAAKKSVEKNKSGENIRNIPTSGLVVRFLDEPHEMNGYFEHWMQNGGPRPCIEGGDCIGCNSDNDDERRKSFRYLGNAYVVDDQNVRAIKLPKTLYEQLLGYYESKGTLLDRDYELLKKGSGKDGTTYLASPDSPSRINLSRFKKLDLDEILYGLLGVDEDLEDEDEEEDEEEAPRRRRPKSTKKRRPVYEDDEEDDDEEDEYEDEEEDDEEPPPRRRAVKKTAAKKSPARRRRVVEDEEDERPVRRVVKKSAVSRKPIKRIR